MKFWRLSKDSSGWGTAMLTSGICFFVVARMSAAGGSIVAGSLGAIYGLGVLGILRLFPVRRWGLAVAGSISGPVPIMLLWGGGANPEERGGVVLATMFLGLVIGLLEWERQERAQAEADAS